MLPAAFRRRDRPVVLGHRGASAEAPENTLEAFALALDQGADGVELDVMRCRTGELVVVHDPQLDRLAGRPWRVAETPWSALRDLDVGSHHSPAFAASRLPLLAQVVAALPSDALLNIELKRSGRFPDWGLAAAVAAVLRQAKNPARLVVSSFDPFYLADFRRAAPTIASGWLFAAEQRGGRARGWLAKPLGAAAVHPQAALCQAVPLRRWRAAGLSVVAWTVDGPATAVRLAKEGVDGLISNRPGLLCRTLEALKPD